jgi:purine-nucleoside phosphorylase
MTEAAAIIRARYQGPAPTTAIVLGSGLGGVADAVRDPTVIPYADLPGFPVPGVAGHGGRLVLGLLGETPVAVLQGRAHYYEHGQADVMAPVIDTVKALGCGTLILTNAAGSLKPEHGPGSVVMISDHVSVFGESPLIGRTGTDRFVGMTDAYDPGLRAGLRAAAERIGAALPEGVYIWFSGPQFETPAEIRLAKLLGADLVGMSTVPETILARHAGLKVAALSNVTNLAAGLSDEHLSHAHTLAQATEGAKTIERLLIAYFGAA